MSVVLLVHGNGTNGTTYVPDYSASAHPIECVGSAAISTAQAVFGTGSLLQTTRNDGFRSADHADWSFGGGNFTIECRLRWTSDNNLDQIIMGQWGTVGNLSWLLNYHSQTNAMEFYVSGNGSSVTVKISASFTPTLNTWYAFAVDFDGTTYRMYRDGTMIGSGTTAVTLFSSTHPFIIGNDNGLATGFLGYIDEVNIDKGTAKYASGAGYTPSASEFTPNTLSPSPLQVSQAFVQYLVGETSPVQVSQASIQLLVREIKKRVMTKVDTRN